MSNSTDYWKDRYARYLRTCERARVKALPYNEWFKWHNS